MKAQEKLVLIRERCEHAEEYRAGNKTQFWAMISDLMKQQTSYEFLNSQQMVTRWVRAELDGLVDEEMGSATKAERNDSKTAVEPENLEVARLQNSLIFQIDDDKPISSLDASRSSAATRTDRSGRPTSSIALAPRLNNKRKRYSNGSKSSCA